METIAQSPANEADQKSFYWSAAANVVFQDPDGQLGTWQTNANVTTKTAFLPLSGVLRLQNLAQQVFLETFPDANVGMIVNVVLLNICQLGYMTPNEYMDDMAKAMIAQAQADMAAAHAKEAGNGPDQ